MEYNQDKCRRLPKIVAIIKEKIHDTVLINLVNSMKTRCELFIGKKDERIPRILTYVK